MNFIKTEGGFRAVLAKKYQTIPGEYVRLIQESSVIGDYEHSMDIPGSSYLLVGKDHHLNREQIEELVTLLQFWLDSKQLPE